jgi:choline dehydrogenase-like flavoprotein
VRSLPSDFEQWNLTNWTYDQMLPVYNGLETFLPTRSHNNHNASSNNATTRQPPDWLKHRGQNGPIWTSPAPLIDPIGKSFVKAAMASGLPMAGANHTGGGAGSFNHIGVEHRIGVGYYEFNIKNGVRHSVANAMLGTRGMPPTWMLRETVDTLSTSKYHKSDGLPPNLLILTGCTVTEVLWSKPATRTDKPTAVGVTYTDNSSGDREEVRLRQSSVSRDQPLSEVILAAGAILTPSILWHSGVHEGGSVAHLPGVGKNLQDHPSLGMAFEIAPEMLQMETPLYAVADEMEDYAVAVQVLNSLEDEEQRQDDNASRSEREFASRRLGAFGTPGFSAGAFLRSPWADTQSKAGSLPPPDIQLTVFPRVIEPHQPKGKTKIDKKVLRSKAMLVQLALLKPEARYEVKPGEMRPGGLKSHESQWSEASVSPGDQQKKTSTTQGERIRSAFSNALQSALPSIVLPKGRQEYLTDLDVERLVWGMEQVRRIMSFPPMSNITTHEIYPGPSVVDDEKGETLHQYVRSNILTNSHWVGTTKMGSDNDPMAVLDESLRVRGVIGLRVFDAGAIPHVPNGNTHSTVCAVASRGVDMILTERKRYK